MSIIFKLNRRWHEKDYLNNIIGDFLIPLVLNARIGSLQNERNVTYFKDAFSKIYSSEYTTDYIFFPVKSRFQFPGWEDVKNQEKALDAALEKVRIIKYLCDFSKIIYTIIV
jgi:hypothetical protein